MEIDQFARDSGLDLPRVGQVGIVTPDIQSALPGVAAAFNLTTWYKPRYAEMQFVIEGEKVTENKEAYLINIKKELDNAKQGKVTPVTRAIRYA